MTLHCQNCGKDTAGKPLTFYGNVICSEECRKQLSERVYFRDTPPEPGSTWFCPHCGASNPLGDPRKNLRPSCAACGKPLDPASAAPPKKGGCLSLLLLALLPLGLLAAVSACATRDPPPPVEDSLGMPGSAAQEPAAARHAARVAAAQAQASGTRPAPTPGAQAAPPAAPAAAAAPVATPAAPTGPLTYEYGAKFEPPVGRVLHGMGQWLTGNAEYLAMLDDPAIRPASELYYQPLGDWPRPRSNIIANFKRTLLHDTGEGRFPKLTLSLFGLDVATNKEVGIDRAIAAGETRYDAKIIEVAHIVRDLGGPVFLGIGEEFSGTWNDYTPYDFPKAYRHVVEIFRREGATNAAFLWTYEPSAPDDFDACDEKGCRWYPGDDVVDWFGLDVFETDELSGALGRSGTNSRYGRTLRFLESARKHGKPVLIAECSAARADFTAGEADGRADWNQWFVPFLKLLADHPQIKGFYYENVDWRTVGKSNALGWKQASINVNEYLTRQWNAELHKPQYLHAGDVALLNGYAASLEVGKDTRLVAPPPDSAPPAGR